jgi:FSR family fosmidomycin resistance protein-like MFS transporter
MISITAMNLYSFVPIFFREKGISVGMIGVFLSAFALGCAIGPLLGSLMAGRFGRLKTLVFSAASSIVFLLVFLPVQNAPIVEVLVLLLLGIALMLPFSVLIDMAQERVPQYLGTVSSLLGGFAWGCGGVLVIIFARVAEAVGVEKVMGGLSLLPLINLGLVLTAPSFRSAKAANKE